ncbi:endonuclease/exonuclease/phosphatase family protein [Saccharicrinis sp. GN24d3]|uniref:endonuclease/exonuclease/phosphatase family protein n=1 Tax=Saccharicrinis sp. GN24d3 TaxID=3458416 RepID=UPI0040367258
MTQIKNNDKTIVKVLSFNILHGATMNNDFDLDRLAKVIADADPDLVAMQEVDFKTNRARKYDLVTELGWRTKMVPLFARAMAYDGGEYGEGILSKRTIISSRNVALPYSKGHEPRAAVEVTLVLDQGDTISFVGTHLDHEEGVDRDNQARKINEVFSKNKYPTILAGDLNATPESSTIKILEKVWMPSYGNNPEPTYPSVKPKIKIDYVMFTPIERWKVIETEVIQDKVATDHCVYLVTLQLLDSIQ